VRNDFNENLWERFQGRINKVLGSDEIKSSGDLDVK
jgi:hypothetical protein